MPCESYQAFAAFDYGVGAFRVQNFPPCGILYHHHIGRDEAANEGRHE